MHQRVDDDDDEVDKTIRTACGIVYRCRSGVHPIQHMDITITLKALGIFFLAILVVDFVFGDLWVGRARLFFVAISRIMSAGAVLEPYHRKVGVMLLFADRRIGSFIPSLRVAMAVFCLFVFVFLFGGLVQAAQENVPLAPFFFRMLLISCVASTASSCLCYTVTYLVLRLIYAGLSPFVPKYFYLILLEIVTSYFLVPLGYASMFLDCPIELCGETELRDRIRVFGDVASAWPSSVILSLYEYIYDFQSAVNLILLYLSMALCVIPTLSHISLLVVDVLRYFLRRVCESLVDVFDRLAASPTPVRRCLWGLLSSLGLIDLLLG